eukprot:7239323-Prymnesium_polylepis.1
MPELKEMRKQILRVALSLQTQLTFQTSVEQHTWNEALVRLTVPNTLNFGKDITFKSKTLTPFEVMRTLLKEESDIQDTFKLLRLINLFQITLGNLLNKTNEPMVVMNDVKFVCKDLECYELEELSVKNLAAKDIFVFTKANPEDFRLDTGTYSCVLQDGKYNCLPEFDKTVAASYLRTPSFDVYDSLSFRVDGKCVKSLYFRENPKKTMSQELNRLNAFINDLYIDFWDDKIAKINEMK